MEGKERCKIPNPFFTLFPDHCTRRRVAMFDHGVANNHGRTTGQRQPLIFQGPAVSRIAWPRCQSRTRIGSMITNPRATNSFSAR
jgi:hypothetical protein